MLKGIPTLTCYPQSEVPANTPQSIRRINQIKQALGYIENHYAEALTLTELSASIGMTPKQYQLRMKE